MAEITKNKITKRLSLLRKAMKELGISVYYIPMNDYHGSEYIGDYFKYIRYFSGFTGSAGTLVVTWEETCLWTDGRYFLQAESQLKGTDIRLMKMGQKDVPTVTDYIVDYCLKNEPCIGFDGRLVSTSFVKTLKKSWEEKNRLSLGNPDSFSGSSARELSFFMERDLPGEVWNEDTLSMRPALPQNDVFILDETYTGKNTVEKLKEIRQEMENQGADYLLLTTLDDIAWLTNIRGSDISYNPVFLSYMIIAKEKALLYMRADATEVAGYLKENGISVRNYDSFYQDIENMVKESVSEISVSPREKITLWMDEASVNYRIASLVEGCCEIVKKVSPVLLKKAVKNPVEIENEKLAHKKDAVAVTKLLYWIKTKVRMGDVTATEISVAEYLEELRCRQENYLGQSFAPIIAYGKHGAIVHYEAGEDTNEVLKNENFLLMDTGGHYLEGTTDITRTVAMGPLSKGQKAHYTAVLQGNLRLMDARFKKGISGANLDYLAREPLYRMGLDFNHGTGHGVGYLLNVHEGPNGFRMRQEAEGVFQEGMITSDEPGFYLEGEYGIRLENLIVCVGDEETPYGQFMHFEPLTLVPFEPEAILVEMLTPRDKTLLNAYHKKVYESLADDLEPEERAWLKNQTKPL